MIETCWYCEQPITGDSVRLIPMHKACSDEDFARADDPNAPTPILDATLAAQCPECEFIACRCNLTDVMEAA